MSVFINIRPTVHSTICTDEGGELRMDLFSICI